MAESEKPTMEWDRGYLRLRKDAAKPGKSKAEKAAIKAIAAHRGVSPKKAAKILVARTKRGAAVAGVGKAGVIRGGINDGARVGLKGGFKPKKAKKPSDR